VATESKVRKIIDATGVEGVSSVLLPALLIAPVASAAPATAPGTTKAGRVGAIAPPVTPTPAVVRPDPAPVPAPTVPAPAPAPAAAIPL